MAVSPLLAGGMIQRTDDDGIIKHQQDTRPAVEQQNAQVQVTKKVEEQRRQVVKQEDTDKTDTHADAREKGKGTYFFRKKQIIKKQTDVPEDRVIKKSMGNSFDMKV